MFKTVVAGNLRPRVPLAYRADETSQPQFGAAYKRDGVVIIALANAKHVEVRATDKVTVSYDPAADGAANLRWCHQCASGKHLARVTPDKRGNVYCDARMKELRALRKANTPAAETKRASSRAAREERVNAAITRPSPSQERLVQALLQGVAKHYGIEHAMFAKRAAQYGLSVEEAVILVRQAA